MSLIGSIASTSAGYLQSLLGVSPNNGSSTTSTSNAAAVAAPSDQGGLSAFANILSELQQLQVSNPTQYKAVTQQISTNLTNAAQTAGDSTVAGQLNQLASAFSQASSTGQLPNIQTLAGAVGGHRGHHGHHGQSLSDALSAYQSAATSSQASQSTNALSIIQSTLTGAGVSTS